MQNPMGASLDRVRKKIREGLLLDAREALLKLELSDPALKIELAFTATLSDAPVADILASLPSQFEAEQESPDLAARLFLVRGLAANRQHNYDQAIIDLNAAEQLYQTLGSALHLAEVLIEQGRVYAWAGQEVRSLRCYTEALAELVKAPDRSLEFQCYTGLGKLNLELGRWADAEAYFQRASRVLPSKNSIYYLRHFLDRAQALVGAERYEPCLEILLNMSDTAVASLSAYRRLLRDRAIALSYLRSGKQVAAKELLSVIAEQACKSVPGEFDQHEIQRLQAEYELRFGEAEKAVSIYRSTLEWYIANSYIRPALDIMCRITEGQVKLNDTAGAEITLQSAIDLARTHGAYTSLADLRTLRERLDLKAVPREESHRIIGYNLYSRPDAYVLRERLGSGAFGTVYRAHDLERDTEVALKQVQLKGTYDSRIRSRLLKALRREIQACSSINHPGVAEIIAWGEDGKQTYYLTQEYVQGPTLRTFMEESRPSALDSIRIVRDICWALTTVHRAGVVHRDLKPENIIMRDAHSPVIVDFGIAILASQTKREVSRGTTLYMSPESLLNFEADSSSDLYAVGLILLEMLGASLPKLSVVSRTKVLRRQRLLHGELKIRRQNSEEKSDKALNDVLKNLLKLRIFGRPKKASLVASRLQDVIDISA